MITLYCEHSCGLWLWEWGGGWVRLARRGLLHIVLKTPTKWAYIAGKFLLNPFPIYIQGHVLSSQSLKLVFGKSKITRMTKLMTQIPQESPTSRGSPGRRRPSSARSAQSARRTTFPLWEFRPYRVSVRSFIQPSKRIFFQFVFCGECKFNIWRLALDLNGEWRMTLQTVGDNRKC